MKMTGVLTALIGALALWLSVVQLSLAQKASNPVIVLSFDGMRIDKLDEFMKTNPSSNFAKFVENGVRASYMQPSYPSLTFPNHWTIMTGVYPGFHGVVANTIYDPSADKKVSLQRDYPTNGQERWWNRSDPIWISAKNQGLKTAAYFWPGSDISSRNPDYWFKYNESAPFEQRVDTIINWQLEQKLDFTCGYFSEPDAKGHEFGPDSPEYMTAIGRADSVLGYFMKKIAENNLTHINIILVSDHGMASLKESLYIGNYIDPTELDLNRTDFHMVSNIHPSSKSSKQAVFEALKKMPNVDVYYKEETPERFNYRASDRIAPIVVVAREGYYLTADPTNKAGKGGHGFDPALQSMKAMFMAQGPAFRKKVVLDPFENVNVKPLVCGLLRIDCPNTNGTINKFQNGLTDQSFFFNSARPSASFSLTTAAVLFLFCKLLLDL